MMATEPIARGAPSAMADDTIRYVVVALIAFLTLVDLFAAQAILPTLVEKFDVSRGTMGIAVNASTFGMAIAGIGVALFGESIDRRTGVWVSLAVLAVPTTLLAFTNDIVLFAFLRVAQGLCMATAFTLTMAYLAEHLSDRHATGALAAYVTGNVASNFFGRILSAALADSAGLAGNFLGFAALNLLGAALVWLTLQQNEPRLTASVRGAHRMSGWSAHLGNRTLRVAFAIGFLILFVFIGTFTYVNFQLAAPPLGLSPMALGLVYIVFLPSMLTTPFGGGLARRVGAGRGICLTLALAVAGLLALLAPSLPAVMAGLALVAVGTFLAQAMVTGQVGRFATSDRASASGIYLASYYCGGLAGSFVIGHLYDRFGWEVSVWVLIAALGLAMFLAFRLPRSAKA